MKYYELTYLISPNLSEEELKTLSKEIGDFVLAEEGSLKKTTEPSRKKLGYPIKKENEAFLITLNFYLSPEKVENLEKNLKSKNQILRYIIFVKEVPKRPVISEKVLLKKEKPPKISRKITEPPKVELKEIDKKIEEILNE